MQITWIPVSERLPETGKLVLATLVLYEPLVNTAVYDEEMRCWLHSEWESGSRVIAWSPLPKPYKEGEL